MRAYDRPTLLVVATSSGWFIAAAVAMRIAFARGRSMLGRPTAWLVALVFGAPFLLLAALTAARRHSDPLRPGITGAALGMAAGIAAGSLVDLWCPVAHVSHLLLGHILPLVVLAALGALAGRCFIRLGSRNERTER